MEYINIDKDQLPYEFEINLNNITYRFLVKYNSVGDFFTIDVYRGDDTLILGEKIVYGKPLFTTAKYLGLPDILPFDTTGKADRVTYENLGENVFLYLVGDIYVD